MIKPDDHIGAQKLPPAMPNTEPLKETDKATILSKSPVLNNAAQVTYGNKPVSRSTSTVNGAYQSDASLDDSDDENNPLTNNRALRRVPSNPNNEGSFLWSLNLMA